MVKNEDGTNFYFNLFGNENDKGSEYGGIIEIIPGLNNIKQRYMKMIEEEDDDKEDLIQIMNLLIDVKYNRLQDLGTDVLDNFSNDNNSIQNYDSVIKLLINENLEVKDLFFPADDIMNDIFRKGMIFDEKGKKSEDEISSEVDQIIDDMFDKQEIHRKELAKLLDKFPKEKEKLEKTMDDMYKLGSEKYNNYKELFRECAKICISNEECCNSFESFEDPNTLEKYKTTFFIAESTSNGENYYSFIINSSSKGSLIHIGTFKKGNDNKYIRCKDFENNELEYGEIIDRSNKYNKECKVSDRYIDPKDDNEYKDIYGVKSRGIGIITEADIIASKSYVDIAEGRYNKYYESEDYKKNDNEVNGLLIGARDANRKGIKDEYNKLKEIYYCINVNDVNDLTAINNLYGKVKTKINEYEENEIVKNYKEISGKYYNICNYEKYYKKWYNNNKNFIKKNKNKVEWYNKNQNLINEYYICEDWEYYEDWTTKKENKENIEKYNSYKDNNNINTEEYKNWKNKNQEFIKKYDNYNNWKNENQKFINKYNNYNTWRNENQKFINDYFYEYYDEYLDENIEKIGIFIKEYKDYKEWHDSNVNVINNYKTYKIGKFKQEKRKIVEKYVDFMNENYNKITVQNYLKVFKVFFIKIL